jgi:hypothetical protein
MAAILFASGTNADAPTTAAPQNVAVSKDVHADESLAASLRAEINELRRKVDKPPKDVWDKVTALSGLSGLVSGLTVALIGFYATNAYNRRQLVISQIQTVEKFMPHLSSNDENTKAGALIAISALGNEQLAIKLATAFGGAGATAALTRITSTASSQDASSAERALKDIFRHLQARIVRITDGQGRSSQGLVVARGAWVIAPWCGVDRFGSKNLSVRLADGRQVSPELLKTDENLGLALLVIASGSEAGSIDLVESDASMGDRVIGLITGREGERLIVGGIVGVTEDDAREKGKIIVSLSGRVGPGCTGSPVVDSKGNLVGLIFAFDEQRDMVILVPARDIKSFLAAAMKDVAVQKS